MANYTYLENGGTVVPDTANVKEAVQNEYQDALGENLSLEDSTPQGRLIDIETDARTGVLENNALVANLFNIKMSYGIALDALGANFGLERNAAASSSVTATITGVNGTVIPANSQASTQTGNLFYAENDITIPESGMINATFLSVERGAIPCPAGSLTKIIDGTLGWETITNEAAATLGTARESDASFKQKFAENGIYTGNSFVADYQNALNKVENLKSNVVYDNGTDETVIVDTVSIAPHSVYVSVDGGTNQDVANAIFGRKSSGSNYTGNTTVTVYDPVYNLPYTVKFDRAAEVQTYHRATISVGTSSAADPVEAVQNAIYEYVNNLKVGQDVSVFQEASTISGAVSGITITNLQIGTTAASLSVADIPIHINQVAKAQLANIQVILNE